MSVDTGNTAWVLVSAAMVLLMTPGLALFYGGLTRAKSVVNMMMKSLAALALVSVLWVLYGYSLAFSEGNALVGGLSEVGLSGILDTVDKETGLPDMAFIGFQLMFAIITVALISGGVADRMRFQSWVIFAAVWATVVYFPVAHWVWGGGFIGADGMGALDFAGGTAVHVNAGAAALALVLVLGKRLGWPNGSTFAPHNLPLVMLGTGLLWFGWFGFNAGSELAADGMASLVLVNTQVATAAAVLGWLLVERVRGTKPSVLGACSGAVAGLVAITPACAYVSPIGAIAIGAIAGALCALAVSLKHKLGYDDALDVVGIHLVGGAVGSVLIGLFALSSLTDGPAGLLYGGGVGLLGTQAAAVGIVGLFSFAVAGVIGLALKFTTGIRVAPEAELAGIDTIEHAEAAYDLSVGEILADDEPSPLSRDEEVEATDKELALRG
ncbi:ammonium transporter [Stackebrandtia nassauensis]|uniref:Ammonium transporter n=1 Tax=Stackebrandtia nassauensis (strain DSM 44728 / CIP 108903 / NRRL B-16338 / NBRC 102104 / LLR-40K-21) TaxID=446470 RepID=D3Q265_STANL|nr:ammonium transporter [Stackebrandtia nassauensis]ADD41932.1 ammonium transporter [Stackebrandtia nassauensis DSM 44728]